MTAERVEIISGPESAAARFERAGGVINVARGYIPHHKNPPRQRIAQRSGESVNDGYSVGRQRLGSAGAFVVRGDA
ncbi:MAG: hypothetical protein R3C26_05210 [Calditrichia bacterium]